MSGCSKHHLSKRLSLPPCIAFAPLSKTLDIIYVGLFLVFLFSSIDPSVYSFAYTKQSWLLWLIVHLGKSGTVGLPTLFFSFNIVLALPGLLPLYVNFRISFLYQQVENEGQTGHPILVPDLSGEISSFSLLMIALAVGFLAVFYQIEKVPFHS